jgi:hypothetical protein
MDKSGNCDYCTPSLEKQKQKEEEEEEERGKGLCNAAPAWSFTRTIY